MAGSARYTAILDACVLYPAPLRDLLLSLAQAGLYHARWSDEIHHEWMRNLLKDRPDLTPAQVERTRDLMNLSVPDSIVSNYGALTGTISLPDPTDRHVLAAAIAGHADAIVTFNLKDFPSSVLHAYNIEAQHPDDFVLNQLELSEIAALSAIRRMRARLRNPPKTAAELIERFSLCGLPQTAARLRQASELI